MDAIWEGIRRAFELLFSGDPETWEILWASLRLSGTATLLALAIGGPIGALLALTEFRGRHVVLGLANTGLALPPVVVGLWVSILLFRNGPLGSLGLLYTPAALVLAQFVIAVPIVVGLTATAFQQLDPRLRVQLLALGASRRQMVWLLVREARLPLLAVVMVAFGAAISEVGAAMTVGGNIPGSTRVLTTAAVTEASKGNYGLALALGFILLAAVYAANLVLTSVQQRGRRR